MKIFGVLIFVLISWLSWPFYLLAIDLNSEVIIKVDKMKESVVPQSISGTFFINAFNTENAVSDIHIQIDDQGAQINVAQVKFIWNKFEVLAGRQLFSWGSGYSFNPTDIFNAKYIGAAFDPSYRRTGRDALVLSFYPSDSMSIELIGALPYHKENQMDEQTTIVEKGQDDIGTRFKFNIVDFDIALSLVQVSKRTFNDLNEPWNYISGLSFKGSLPVVDWGIWGEGAYYHQQKEFEISAGLEFIYDDVMANIEYYRNSFGHQDFKKYDQNLLLRGRSLARDYLIPSITYTYDEHWMYQAFSFFNLNDQSLVVGIMIEHVYNDMVQINFAPLLIEGKQDTEFGTQKSQMGSYGFGAIIKASF